jgi:Holliday junction resolvase RusA-like endonuclease
MILIHWTGQVVADNRKTTRTKHGVTVNRRAYAKGYVESVAWTIRAEAPGVHLERPGLFVQFSLGAATDATNALKGLLDGVQASGLVANDRNIAPVTVLPTLVHPRGELDEASMAFYENGRG